MTYDRVSYQIVDFFWKSIVLFQWFNLLISKDTPPQTSLLRFIDDRLENVNDCARTGACLFDISKCFDSTNHTILLKKLEMYGITSTELKWFSSYLEDINKLSNFTRKHPSSVILHVAFHRIRFQAQFCSYYLSMIYLTSLYICFCVLNMHAEDVIFYTSATWKDELECRLQVCIDNISNWYNMNKLCIDKKKSNAMVIGSKWQLKLLNLDGFTISIGSDKLFLPDKPGIRASG